MTTSSIVYFAYGSNMYTPRLRYRVPGAIVVGVAHLRGHQLRFHKRSNDTSGKCDIHPIEGLDDRVTGVLFEIPRERLSNLHRAEGRGGGYDDIEIRVIDDAGRSQSALTYKARASHIDETLRPFTWYWEFVAAGAREHNLPNDYVERRILAVEHRPDPDRVRDAEERSKVLGEPHHG